MLARYLSVDGHKFMLKTQWADDSKLTMNAGAPF